MSSLKTSTAKEPPLLELTKVSKVFSSLSVVKEISFSVRRGEFVSIIGPSGCGKSTLLHLVAGLVEPTSGSLFLDGIHDTRLGKFGYMPQSSTLFSFRTALENCMLGLEMKRISRAASTKIATKMLKDFGLEKFSNYYPSQLSGGMQQKIALLRTILFNNSFLLLDEPFGSLDALTRFSLQLWLLRMRKKYASTVLFVTHDIREAILLSDRIVVMSPRPGRIIADIAVRCNGPRDYSWLQTERARQLEGKLLSYFFKDDNKLYAPE